MYKPLFVDTLMHSMHYPRGHTQAIRSTVNYLERVAKLGSVLNEQFGPDAKQNVLQHDTVEYALQRILEYHTQPDSPISEHDHTIFHFFVINKLEQAQRILEDELQVV